MRLPTRQAQMLTYLDFEKPVAELDGKIEELRRLAAADAAMDIKDEVGKLETKSAQMVRELYAKLTPWQKTLVARHPNRPHFNDYVRELIADFTPLAGDRAFAEDNAIIGGLGSFRGRPVMVIGHEKGNDTKSRLKHNFGMAQPDGYRKAIRLMTTAEKFDLPVITLVDTPGAYPGISAEERGQAEAIARSTERCLTLGVPIVSAIVGEGGSGGAVALATADRVIMLEHSIYSVISPEGCASILWHSAEKAQDAAAAMKVTAQDLLGFKVIDQILPEPVGGAHRDAVRMIADVGDAIEGALNELAGLDAEMLRNARAEKFLAIGRTGLN
jgi:acetyl-CoA carboxylase carboxyl transferase subunit alpha